MRIGIDEKSHETRRDRWKGGFYERLVGLVKRCLRKRISCMRLTLDQFIVLLSEVEAVINTRPLTYV